MLTFVVAVLALVAAIIALCLPGVPGPAGAKGEPGATYYPVVAVHEIKPGSIVHLHNVDFGDDLAIEQGVMDDFLKAVGHTDFIIVRTEDGMYDAPDMVAVWPEGEAADRLKALLKLPEVSS